MNSKTLKLVGYLVLLVLILNLILFALGKINWLVFWGIILIGALFAYKILPRIKK